MTPKEAMKTSEDKREPKVKCPICGKMVATLIPRGGDGSATVFRTHKHAITGARCSGSRRFAYEMHPII